MPSPFKRHSTSRQIRPMSQAELDASIADLEAREEGPIHPEMRRGIYQLSRAGKSHEEIAAALRIEPAQVARALAEHDERMQSQQEPKDS